MAYAADSVWETSLLEGAVEILVPGSNTVSYTHLDVYKRQVNVREMGYPPKSTPLFVAEFPS